MDSPAWELNQRLMFFELSLESVDLVAHLPEFAFSQPIVVDSDGVAAGQRPLSFGHS